LKVTRTKTLVLVSALVIFSSSLVAFALTTLFSQTIPGQTFTTSTTTTTTTSTTFTPGLTEGRCGNTLVLDTDAGNVPSAAGQSATLVFTCSVATSPDAAFTLASGFSSDTVTPTFTLPSGWSLSVDSLADNPSNVGTCTGGPYEVSLTSGSSVFLGVDGGINGFVYCLTSSSASTFSSLSVTWSQ